MLSRKFTMANFSHLHFERARPLALFDLSSSCLLLILGPPCDTSYMSFNRCPWPATSSVPHAPRSCNKTPGGVCDRNHLQCPPYSHLDASHRSPQWVRFCSTVMSSSIPSKLVSLLFRYLSTSMFLFQRFSVPSFLPRFIFLRLPWVHLHFLFGMRIFRSALVSYEDSVWVLPCPR